MRRLLVMAALFGLLLLTPLFMPAKTSGVAPDVLLLGGFLILAAHTLGELAAGARLPRIIGYLAVGGLLAAPALGLADARFLLNVGWFEDAAIALLALWAGAALELRGGDRSARTVSSLALLQVVLVSAATGGLLYAIAPLVPALAGAPVQVLAVAATLVGLVSALDAPLATVAVIDETTAEGDLTRTVVSASVLRSLLVLVFLAVAGVVAPSIATQSAQLSLGAALRPLGLTLGFGLTAGVVLVVLERLLKLEVLVLLVLVLGATAIARGVGAEPLPAFLLAGIVVRAASREDSALLHQVSRVLKPTALLLFALLGARLDLRLVATMALPAGALVLARTLAFAAAGAVAGRVPASPLRSRLLGGAFVTQASLALGAIGTLPGILPGAGPELAALLTAALAMNVVLGPAALRLVLGLGGETEQARRARRRAAQKAEAPEETGETQLVTHPAERPAIPEPEHLPPELTRALSLLRTRLFETVERFDKDVLDERSHEAEGLFTTMRALMRQHGEELAERLEREKSPVASGRLVRTAAERIAKDWRDTAAFYIATLQERGPETQPMLGLVESVEDLVLSFVPVRLPLDRALFAREPGDRLPRRLRKALGRLRRRVRDRTSGRRVEVREVPLPRLGRLHLSGPLPERLAQSVAPFLGHLSARLWKHVGEIHEELEARLLELETSTHPHDRLEEAIVGIEGDLQAAASDLAAYRREIVDRLVLSLGNGFADLLESCRTAGSSLLPPRFTDPSRVFERNRRGREELLDLLGRWWMAARGTAGQVIVRLDTAAVRRPALDRADEASSAVRGVLETTLPRFPRRLRDACVAERTRLDEALTPGATRAAVAEALDEALAGLGAAADASELERLRDEGKLRDLLTEVSRKLRLLSEKLPPSVDVLATADQELSPEAPPTESRLVPFPLRELASVLLTEQAGARLSSAEPAIERGTESTFMTLVDGSNTLRFHLEAALAELAQLTSDEVPPDVLRIARDFALGGIDRVHGNLSAFIEALHGEADLRVRDIERVIGDAVDRLRDLARRADPDKAAAHLRGRELAGAVEEPAETVRSVLGRARALVLREVRPAAEAMARRVGARMGLVRPTSGRLLDAAEKVNLRVLDRTDVPESYRRLFALGPVAMDSLFVARPAETAIIEAAIARWERGDPTALLITGQAGVGRQSLLERALRTHLAEFPTQRRRIGARVTTARDVQRELSRLLGSQRDLTEEELRAKMSGGGRTLRVVEEAHRLFLPHPLALGGVERFHAAVVESSHHVMWVATIETHALAQLDRLLGLSDAFTHVIEVGRFDRAATEAMVRARHQVSGLGLRFVAAPDRRKVPGQEALAAEAFTRLHHLSDGHPALILFYWVRAIRRYDEATGVIEVGPFEPLRFDFLERLPTERVLELQRLLLFGAMTPAGFALSQRVSRTEAERRLQLLARAHLARSERVGHELRFSLNPVLVPPLTRLLERRNML